MRTKLKAVIASNPDKDLRIVFMQDNFLTKAGRKLIVNGVNNKASSTQ